jgi:hypothetical protein
LAPLGEVLGLDHHAARTAPALACAVGELPEDARRLGAVKKRLLGAQALAQAQTREALVLGQPEQVVDAAALAPGHDGLAAESRVGADDDPGVGPAGSDLGDDAGQLLDAAR